MIPPVVRRRVIVPSSYLPGGVHPQAALHGSPGGPGVPDTPAKRVIVTGSRHLDAPAQVRAALTAAWREAGAPIVVVHGACPTGADRHADEWAVEHACAGITVERHPADWAMHGRAAGPIRNAHMVAQGAWRVLAFPHPTLTSRGTRDCIRRALAAGIDVRYPLRAEDGAA